jgi:polyphosphate kinase
MERNFFRRVEVAFPIQREAHRERILRDLDFCLSDTCQAWRLLPDGSYERIPRSPQRPVSAQVELLAKYAAGAVVSP